MTPAAIDPAPAWSNACSALTASLFVTDIASAVSNDGAAEAGKRWLLALVLDCLKATGHAGATVWQAYDFAVDDLEAIGTFWPMMHVAAAKHPGAQAELPALARFVAERLPAIWKRPPWLPHSPVTRSLVLADRANDLVSLFSIGLKPNGSKDPFALRRAANHWLLQVVWPRTMQAAA